jgi:tellurite resistance-related uncharacterized protein
VDALTERELSDVHELPSEARPYRRTPEFTEATIPQGLLREHTTKRGVWARIVVLEGSLLYRVPTLGTEAVLNEHHVGVVQPEVPHEVEPQGPVRFYVEFWK